MTDVKIKTISGGVYFVKTAEPFEKYVERMTSFNGYIYASTIIKQPTYKRILKQIRLNQSHLLRSVGNESAENFITWR